MIIKEDFPPNIEMIKIFFPHLEEYKPVFCYGDTLYNPFKAKLTIDIEVHEEVHSKQQGTDPEGWYYNYFHDIHFRLKQEIEAYGTQLQFINSLHLPSKMREWKEEKLAEGLSSPLYGSMVSYAEAKSKIRNYAKTNR